MGSKSKGHAMDRRSFLKGAFATTALGAGAMTLGCAAGSAEGTPTTAEGEAFERSVVWDAEYDVVVVGFGGAGAATAITAADAGARVLILEKAPEGYSGGNSNVCMQWVCYSEDKEKMRTYFKTLRGEYDTPSDEMLDVYIDEMMKNKSWFESLGAPNAVPFEYQEFPQFPGVDAFTPITTNGNSGINKPTNFGGDGATYNLLKDNVLNRADSIDIWYEAPGRRLVQDPVTKIVHGVVAEVEGAERTIRAKNGVVLTCGGYENNPQMQQDYNNRKFWPSLGRALYNEGDGIKMAQNVGADLWHMSNIVSTNGEFYDWETQTASFVFMIYAASCGIVVGADGTRMKEDDIVFGRGQRHGKLWNHGMYMNAWLPDEMYYVFDQAVLDQGQIHSSWSSDGSEELEKGWIVKADTLEELAGKLGLEDDAVATMAQTVATYNGFCAEGVDPQFGRTKNLEALSTPPYYGIPLTHCTCNTQGGPRRDEQGRIIDVEGNPIPHLYEAGELGDIWSNLYQASCNLGGGMIFGRISGANAAAEKEDNLRESLLEGQGYAPTVKEVTYETASNQFIGKGKGKGQAPMVVRVTVDDAKLADVEVLEHYETDGLLPVAKALESMPAAMVQAGGANVDVVSGATRTAGGLIAAVLDALSQAGIDDTPTAFAPGTYTGEGKGMNGPIKVTLTVDDASIVSVDSIADPGETPGRGGAEAIADGTYARLIMNAQGAGIDVVTGATITSSGVQSAVRDALQKAAK